MAVILLTTPENVDNVKGKRIGEFRGLDRRQIQGVVLEMGFYSFFYYSFS